jgi:four helix bundle protein
MKENIIRDKSFKFAVRIVGLYQYLKDEKKEYVLSKQILKSGSSIGANVEEADGGISKAEFSSKLSIAYKEAKETQYWLRLLKETNFIAKNIFDSMIKDLDEIMKILFSILKTTRINNK